MARFPHTAACRHPGEAFLDLFADALAHGVARMARRAAVHAWRWPVLFRATGGATPQGAQLRCEISDVKGLVSSHVGADAPARWASPKHRQGGCALRRSPCLRKHRLNDLADPVLHQQVCQLAELAGLASSVPEQAGVWIAGC